MRKWVQCSLRQDCLEKQASGRFGMGCSSAFGSRERTQKACPLWRFMTFEEKGVPQAFRLRKYSSWFRGWSLRCWIEVWFFVTNNCTLPSAHESLLLYSYMPEKWHLFLLGQFINTTNGARGHGLGGGWGLNFAYLLRDGRGMVIDLFMN